jgi:glycosyltransferase involved in cell wall biosynthesis
MQKMLAGWGVPAAHIHYLPNGVDRARFSPVRAEELAGLRASLGLEGKQVVVYIGSLSLANHAVGLLLEAFGKVRTALPEARLLVVGSGEDFEFLKQYASDLEIRDVVSFTGRIPAEKTPNYYRLGDVSIDPVQDDDAARGRSPLKMFESWACDTPFITSKVGDRELLAGSPPAALFAQPGNAGSLADQIIKLLKEADLAQTVVQRGQERVKEFYWDHLVETLVAVYSLT